MHANEMKIQSLSKLFKQNVVKFIDELIIKFPTINNLLLMRILINDTIDPLYLMETFSITLDDGGYDMIRLKNEKIFMPKRNGGIFKIPDIINPPDFYEMYIKLSKDEQNTVWDWMNTFSQVCEKYASLCK
jgi:hypothetical protein